MENEGLVSARHQRALIGFSRIVGFLILLCVTHVYTFPRSVEGIERYEGGSWLIVLSA